MMFYLNMSKTKSKSNHVEIKEIPVATVHVTDDDVRFYVGPGMPKP